MNKKYNVLVFPGGTEIGLEINKALRQSKDIKLFSAGSNVSNHAPYMYARHFTLPNIYEQNWIESLNQIISDHSIDYIYPAFDDIIVALATNAEKIKAKIVSSPMETCLVTRSKSLTYRHLANCVPVPTIFTQIDLVSQYPVFVKPDKGQGAEDTHLVRNRDQLQQLLLEKKDMVVLEYLPGEEYTVDCFSDRVIGLLFCNGRERVRTKSGISMNSREIPQQETFVAYAKSISSKLTFHGAWFFQVKKDKDGIYKLLEVAPRIAGTMALNRVKGINFPLLSIYEQERIPVVLLKNNACVEIDRALVNRYRHNINFSTVYVDLDDTLIINDKVNIQVISFLYQCINEGKKVVLLTKHDKDLSETLAKYRLEGVCDELIHINKTDSKADYIRELDAILVDDSFSERKAANEKLGIYTFDCSMLEVLMDERV